MTRISEVSRARVPLNVQIEVGEIPRAGRQARKHFDAIADVIVRGWDMRKKAERTTESAHSWFKRNIYRLIKAYVEAERSDVFLTMARVSGRSLVGMKAIKDNPFKLALFAMWSDNQSLTRHQQRVFGNQMLYAHLHGVAPEYLIGFIRTAGSAQTIAEKLEKGTREPGF